MSQADEQPRETGPKAREPVFLLPGVIAILGGHMVAIQAAASFILQPEAFLEFTIWFGFLPYRLIASGEIAGGLLPLVWSPLTHALLHAGWDHLLVNVAWFAIFGTPVARRYGAWPTLVVFFLSAAAGAAAFAATTLPQVQVLIGASGGVAGLTGAATRFIFQPVIYAPDPASGERRPVGRHIASLRELFVQPRSRFFVVIWVVLNAAVPLLPALTGTSVQIAWQAHLGGFFAGLLIVSLFERRN